MINKNIQELLVEFRGYNKADLIKKWESIYINIIKVL